MDSNDYVVIGKILGAWGIKGGLKVLISEDFADKIAENLKERLFYNQDSGMREFRFKLVSKKKNIFLMQENQISNRNDAEKLAGLKLLIKKLDMPALSDDEYLYSDLTGTKILDEDENFIGTIKSIHNFGAGDVVEIQLEDETIEFWPFSKDIFLHISKKYIIAKKPNYLM